MVIELPNHLEQRLPGDYEILMTCGNLHIRAPGKLYFEAVEGQRGLNHQSGYLKTFGMRGAVAGAWDQVHGPGVGIFLYSPSDRTVEFVAFYNINTQNSQVAIWPTAGLKSKKTRGTFMTKGLLGSRSVHVNHSDDSLKDLLWEVITLSEKEIFRVVIEAALNPEANGSRTPRL